MDTYANYTHLQWFISPLLPLYSHSRIELYTEY